MTLWKELPPEGELVAALDYAGTRKLEGPDDKRNWGGRFADRCALMFSNAVRRCPQFNGMEIRPNPDGTGRESLTGVGGRGQKKVDVIASTLASGLQLAISLKAENFAGGEGAYGKNLKNRLYELQDEVRAIHDYQPRAYVLGVFFLPIGATADRPGASSFARTVANLRARTGRTDFTSPGQMNRLDRAVVGLYVPEATGGMVRGAVRYFDSAGAPPRRGRPKIPSTWAIDELVRVVAEDFRKDAGDITEYAEPEADS